MAAASEELASTVEEISRQVESSSVIANEAVSDRLFSLLIFLHIGLPLALLAAMWLHVARLAKPARYDDALGIRLSVDGRSSGPRELS